MEGFVPRGHAQKLPQMRAELVNWVEQALYNTIVNGGIVNPEIVLVIFGGKNYSKLPLDREKKPSRWRGI